MEGGGEHITARCSPLAVSALKKALWGGQLSPRLIHFHQQVALQHTHQIEKWDTIPFSK